MSHSDNRHVLSKVGRISNSRIAGQSIQILARTRTAHRGIFDLRHRGYRKFLMKDAILKLAITQIR